MRSGLPGRLSGANGGGAGELAGAVRREIGCRAGPGDVDEVAVRVGLKNATAQVDRPRFGGPTRLELPEPVATRVFRSAGSGAEIEPAHSPAQLFDGVPVECIRSHELVAPRARRTEVSIGHRPIRVPQVET